MVEDSRPYRRRQQQQLACACVIHVAAIAASHEKHKKNLILSLTHTHTRRRRRRRRRRRPSSRLRLRVPLVCHLPPLSPSMEAARRGLVVQPSPLPPCTSHAPRAHLRKTAFSSCSVFHGQASHAVSSTPLTSVVRHFPASILLQEQPDDLRRYPVKDDIASQVTLDGRCMKTEESGSQDKDDDFDEYLKHFERQFLYSPGYWYPLPKHMEEKTSLPESINFIISDTVIEVKSGEQNVVKDNVNVLLPEEVLALAKEAVLASQEAASLVESHSLAAHIHGFRLGSGPKNSATEHIRVEQATVRSKRFLERRSKRRWTPKKATTVISNSTACSVSAELGKKIGKGLDANAPLGMFLWGPETKQLLTVKEERDLFNKVQDLMRLEEVKQKLHLQFGHEPTLPEWAEAAGLTCHALQSRLYVGNRSREKMIYANFRLVVHVAKQYQGKGLNIQDLLQEGSMGLMWSLEKFKPKAGCRFPTYAYWWIRQSIRRAMFQHSRTIRLPENVYTLLKKIKDVRKLYLQEGHVPTSEELARRVGITKERLEGVLASSRTPVSIQNCAWKDQDVTVQEVTADPKVEAPELSVAKQMMRQHVRNLLGVLSPRERRILQLRYGIGGGGGGEAKSLSEIGAVFGLSKERVRQLESRALDRLKEHLTSQGLGAYVNLLV